jgi:hypothetical protein
LTKCNNTKETSLTKKSSKICKQQLFFPIGNNFSPDRYPKYPQHSRYPQHLQLGSINKKVVLKVVSSIHPIAAPSEKFRMSIPFRLPNKVFSDVG